MTETIRPWGVTITGADDDVDPESLVSLSREFPFVEWGILLASGRAGTPRYPTEAWVQRLMWAKHSVSPHVEVRLSAHLCGGASRLMQEGRLRPSLSGFDRVQINGFDPSSAEGLPSMVPQGMAAILQARGPQELKGAILYAAGVSSCYYDEGDAIETDLHILYDPSGGRGVPVAEWPLPAAAQCGFPLGYAGGIHPGNVLDVLRALSDREPSWIDMESGVRTNDAFDLAKVRSVLEQVAKFCEGMNEHEHR